jgi:phospholipase C
MLSPSWRDSNRSRVTAGIAAILLMSSAEMFASAHAAETETPIEHVIIIVGENRSFDHLFATYMPPNGESVWNLLSKGPRNPRR